MNGQDTRASGNERIIEGQKHALELAMHGASLREVLEVVVRTVESQSASEVFASILLLDDDGKHLLLGAAPSLPKPYNDAIHGIAIGPSVGSCGTAAFTAKTVVVTDIQTDPLWAAFKGLAGEHGLRACWSTPVLATDGSVLATFALYHRRAQEPSARDREVVELLANTAAVVLERDRHARRLEQSEKTMRAFVDNLPALAWTAKPDGHIDYFNARWNEYTGVSAADLAGEARSTLYDPAVLPLLESRWQESLASGEPFEMEHTIKGKSGVRRWFLARVAPMRDASGTIVRWFGTATDIDDIKASKALAEAMTEQSRDVERALVEMRAETERARKRIAELEAAAAEGNRGSAA
jgi:PAS domain S-box-containing protein